MQNGLRELKQREKERGLKKEGEGGEGGEGGGREKGRKNENRSLPGKQTHARTQVHHKYTCTYATHCRLATCRYDTPEIDLDSS